MADTLETPKKEAPKKAAPKKAAPKTQTFTKEEMQEAINAAVQTAVQNQKPAEAPAPEPAPAPVQEKKVLEEAKYSGSENLMTVIATIILVLGIIGAIVLIIVGIVQLAEPSYSYYDYHSVSGGMGVGLIIYGALILLLSLMQFGMIKLYVNMSYRLTSIDKVLRAK